MTRALALAAASLALPLAFAARCAREAPPPHVAPAPRRVGLLVYDVLASAAHRAVGLDTGVEVAPAGRVFAVVTVRRANATQADARASAGGMRYVAPDGVAYSPYRVKPVRCYGGDEGCAALDPGGARVDELVYAVPETALGAGARLRVTAAPGEPGPRAAEFPLPPP